MNKVIKFVATTTLLGVLLFCEVTDAMRESPYAKSMSDVRGRLQGVTLNDEWMSFSKVCDLGKTDEIVKKGIIFAEDAIKALKEDLTLDESIRYRIMFLCNSEILNLLGMFKEEDIEENSDLQALFARLNEASNL